MAMKCSVCYLEKANVHRMRCFHSACSDCFDRYILGSLKELNSFIRCCICGNVTPLIYESRKEEPFMKFGRHLHPKIADPMGLCAYENGFVLTDQCSKRVFLLNTYADIIVDFAILHGYELCRGVLITKNPNNIIVPLKNSSQTCLAYYNTDGIYLNSAYMPERCNITDLTLTSSGEVLASDDTTGTVYLVNDKRIVDNHWVLPRVLGEDHDSKASSISINSQDCIYVTDSANHCVKVTDKNGKLLFKFGSKGQRPTQFNNPTGIAIDSKDQVIVTDRGNNRVQLFTAEGRFIRFIVRFNQTDDVYMMASNVSHTADNIVSVLLTASNAAPAGEVRLYWTND